MKQRYVITGAVLAALAVAFGAFGAHVLKPELEPQYLESFRTATQYHMYHALAILFVSIYYRYKQSPHLHNAFIAFVIGIVLFSGSLYFMIVGKLIGKDFRWIGPVTPVGGISFIVGWILICLAFFRKKS